MIADRTGNAAGRRIKSSGRTKKIGLMNQNAGGWTESGAGEKEGRAQTMSIIAALFSIRRV
jgi:hypothetical protein